MVPEEGRWEEMVCQGKVALWIGLSIGTQDLPPCEASVCWQPSMKNGRLDGVLVITIQPSESGKESLLFTNYPGLDKWDSQ